MSTATKQKKKNEKKERKQAKANKTQAGPAPKQRRSWRSRLKVLLLGLVGLAILVGVPVLLWTFIGNPLTRIPTDPTEIRGYIESRYLPSELVVGVLAIVLWLLWLQYVWALLWELMIVGPAAARGGLARTAPFVPRITRAVASSVVSGLLTATVVVGSSSLASVGSHMIASPAALATDSPSQAEAMESSPTEALVNQVDYGVHLVGETESLWSISKRNDAMVKQLLEINEHQIRSPIDLRPGMELIVPVSLVPAVATPPAADEEQQGLGSVPDDDVSNDGDIGDEHEVIEGDNLWNISEARLQQANGSDPSNQEVADHVAEVIAENPDVIEDPDLIYPGEIIQISDGSVIPDPVNATKAGAAAGDTMDPADAASDDGLFEDDSNDAEAAADHLAAIASETREFDPEDFGIPVVMPENERSYEPHDQRSVFGVDSGGIRAAVAVSVAGGIVAASGLLMTLIALRRKRGSSLGAGFLRRRSGDGNQLLLELSQSSDHEFVRWAAGRLQSLVIELPAPETAAPVAVQLSLTSWLTSESTVSVVWDTPMPTPIRGWRSIGEREWRCTYDDTISASVDPGPAAFPGLVTIGDLADGDHEGQQLLIDLEAYGSIAIGGRQDQIEAAVAAIALEAGSGELLSNIAVTTVDFNIEVAEKLDRVSACPEDVALAHAEAIVAQHQAQQTDGRETAGPANGQHDVELFIINTVQANTDRWLDIAQARSGIAVLLKGDMRSSRLGARLTIDDEGIGLFSGLDVNVNVCGVLPTVAAKLADLFDNLLEEPDPADQPGDQTAAEVIADWAAEGFAVAPGTEFSLELLEEADRPPAPELSDQDLALSRAVTEPVGLDDVIIRVLGPCRSDDFPQLASRALSLVAFLAVQPDRCATKDDIIEAVWGGRQVSDGQFSKVVAAARAQLGPERLPKQLSSDGLFRLENVRTDLDDLRALLAEADGQEAEMAAPLMRAASKLITGPPFSGVAIDWAAGRRYVDYAAELIEVSVVRAVHVLVEAGDGGSARGAAHAGLIALPGNEPIHRAYMRVAARRNDLRLVRSTYEQLRQSLSLLYPTEQREPSAETQRLLAELTEQLEVAAPAEPQAQAQAQPPSPSHPAATGNHA